MTRNIPQPTLPAPAQSRAHTIACKYCPSAHFPPDPEVLDIMTLSHEERVETAFPCGWNGRRYCRGYCDLMGISDADLLNKED